MQMRWRWLAVGALGLGVAGAALIAGPLTPPAGPVASTYKTLQEVEPRTPVFGTDVVISSPGSYYLTGNVGASSNGPGSYAIFVAASDVTLDLNGFAVQGGETAIILDGVSNVTIRNGIVRGTTGSGIFAAGTPGPDHAVRNVRMESITDAAILLGPSASVSDVRMVNVGDGIFVGHSSLVSNVSIDGARRSGMTLGDGSIAQGCTVVSGLGPPTFSGHGFRLLTGAMAINCVARSNAGPGFILEAAAVARQCDASDNAGGGFMMGSHARLDRCTSTANGSSSGVIVLTGATGWTIDGCTISGHTSGIAIGGSATQGAIRNNTIRGLGSGTGSGILSNTATAGDITITGNAISLVLRGITLDGGFSSVVGNAFTGVGAAVTNSGGGAPFGTNVVAAVVTGATASTVTNSLVNTQN